MKNTVKVIIAFEHSGTVRNAFNQIHGIEAFSCDLLPDAADSPNHIQADIHKVLRSGFLETIDLMIAHPPCTYLAASGIHWTKRGLRDPQLTQDALDMVRSVMGAKVPRIAVENPVGLISTHIRRPSQYIQPYDFGEDASKKTGLWLKGLPKLLIDPRQKVHPRRTPQDTLRWGNQTDRGDNILPPSEDRWALRSKTYPGIARAMAEQWGAYLVGIKAADGFCSRVSFAEWDSEDLREAFDVGSC